MKFTLYLKLFLATGIPAGLLWGLVLGGGGGLLGTLPGMPFSSIQGFVGGFAIGGGGGLLLFGVAMSALLGGMHFSKTDDPRVRHRRTVVLDASMEEANQMCRAAIRGIPNTTVKEKSSTGSRIVAKKRDTARSLGDLITCGITSTSAGQQTIVIESRPSLRTILVDGGSNLANVDAIASYLAQPQDVQPHDTKMCSLVKTCAKCGSEVLLPSNGPWWMGRSYSRLFNTVQCAKCKRYVNALSGRPVTPIGCALPLVQGVVLVLVLVLTCAAESFGGSREVWFSIFFVIFFGLSFAAVVWIIRKHHIG